MKIKYLKLKNWLFLALIGALGLGSCDSSSSLTRANVRGGARLVRNGATTAVTNSSQVAASAEEQSELEKERAAAKAQSDAAAKAMAEQESGKSVSNSNKRGNLKRVGSQNNEPADMPEEEPLELNEPREEMPVMYGVPTVNYVVKGKVVSEKGKPVQGMQIILMEGVEDATPENLNLDNKYVREMVVRQSDTTAADGSFEVKAEGRVADYMNLYVRDIDGPSKGNYQNEVIAVPFSNKDVKDSGHGWRLGTAVKELLVKPKPKR
ncbi:MAG: radical SAM-associated putative lipoprotein [Bacteroidales bacterium]|nr:radical SAM-associated putative lipoprotein [Candidatus Colimorpha onthohippi]